MKVQNTKQTVNVGVSILIPSAATLSPEIFKKMKEYSAASEESKAESKKELIESLPREVKKELAELGVETPLDVVPVSLSLSSFLFDIYMSGVSAPSAPLAKKIFEKKLLDLADKLKNPEEFDFDGEFQQAVREVMLDDKKWENARIHVEIKVGERNLAIPLIHKAANMFPDILEASTKIFLELESAKYPKSAEANS